MGDDSVLGLRAFVTEARDAISRHVSRDDVRKRSHPIDRRKRGTPIRFAILLPADDLRPAVLMEMARDRSIYEQIREMIGGLPEILLARGLRDLAPELWSVMLVDDTGHAEGLPLNHRAGQLYGSPIAGEAVLCQQRRPSFGGVDLVGFTRAEAEKLKALLPG